MHGTNSTKFATSFIINSLRHQLVVLSFHYRCIVAKFQLTSDIQVQQNDLFIFNGIFFILIICQKKQNYRNRVNKFDIIIVLSFHLKINYFEKSMTPRLTMTNAANNYIVDYNLSC